MENGSYQDAAEQATMPGMFDKVVEGVAGKILANSGSSTVFGEPVHAEDRTVVPVARLTYNFGFGAGLGEPDHPADAAPGGGGGGGNVSARPVGYIETTPEGSRFVPIIDWSRLLSIAVTFVGISVIMTLLGTILNPGKD